MSPEDVGVVAIGRNEGERLEACLLSIARTTPNLVYVDSWSTDDSVTVAKRLGAIVVELDPASPFTAARARNEGFKALQSSRPNFRFVQFVDGDCILADDWLERANRFLERNERVAVVCGRRRERRPDSSLYNQLCDIEWNTPIGEAIACGGDALIRVNAFEAMQGYRRDLIAGEEPELCVRLRAAGWKIWRLDADMTFHDAAMTRFRQWWMRAVRCGHAYAEVSLIHRTTSTGIWKKETVRAIFWGGLLPVGILLGALLHPAALLGLLAYPLQTCKIAIARGRSSFESWIYALFVMVGKFAEFEGILKYYWRRCLKKGTALIEYK